MGYNGHDDRLQEEKSTMTSLNVADAKKQFSDLLGRVAYGGETILITRRGKPMAKLVPADTTEPEQRDKTASVVDASWGALRLDPEQVRELLREEDGLFDA
jgi:prevent-host-death family protein